VHIDITAVRHVGGSANKPHENLLDAAVVTAAAAAAMYGDDNCGGNSSIALPLDISV